MGRSVSTPSESMLLLMLALLQPSGLVKHVADNLCPTIFGVCDHESVRHTMFSSTSYLIKSFSRGFSQISIVAIARRPVCSCPLHPSLPLLLIAQVLILTGLCSEFQFPLTVYAFLHRRPATTPRPFILKLEPPGSPEAPQSRPAVVVAVPLHHRSLSRPEVTVLLYSHFRHG